LEQLEPFACEIEMKNLIKEMADTMVENWACKLAGYEYINIR